MVREKGKLIHPQAVLQPERVVNFRPENMLESAEVLVALHNAMLRVLKKRGFGVINDQAPMALVCNSALLQLSKIANLGPWLDKNDRLVRDFQINTGFRNARCVCHGAEVGCASQITASWGSQAFSTC